MTLGAAGAVAGGVRFANGGSYARCRLSFFCKRRQQQAWKEYQHKVRLNRLIAKFDHDRNRKLEKDQLIELLTAIDSSTPEGTTPSEEEVNFVIRSADKSNDGCISADELEDAMCVWMTYMDHREDWDELLKKHGKNDAGTLTREECKQYLKDLNGGRDVEEYELDMVMIEAEVNGSGVITKMKLRSATAVWYGHVERQHTRFCMVL
ncbi:unnamed protein product [Prorocentrum cordatum]|uniref:EF-hand domain-containing protein n=1 Tax=Prorocentrum cordatum TaxID=2364126 RepID=A0ABN9XR71_9DINO|nr:unnamed protein product [Polarella glacialis]